jgi:hypothetical protein
MRMLLAAGAVADTWAPNGSSALMLAAVVNGVSALKVRRVCACVEGAAGVQGAGAADTACSHTPHTHARAQR